MKSTTEPAARGMTPEPLPPIATPASATIRILVADDHPVTREGLALILDAQPDLTVVAQAGTGEEAVRLFRECQPDLVIMDLQMPGMGGARAIREIVQSDPLALVLVLTTFDGDEDIHRGMQAGARAYLLKDAPRDELLTAIRAAAAGQRVIGPSVGARLAERMQRHDLTDRERDVLRHLARGLSNREIASQLGIAEGTVKSHLNNLVLKLGVSNRLEAVVAAQQRGLLRD